jgi:hypothetical protein
VDGVNCFHSDPPAVGEPLAAGQEMVGIVVCSHVFGVGVYLAEEEAWGHVNTPALAPDSDGKIVLPPIGARLPLRVLGYSGTGQLRLAHHDVGFESA